MDSERYQRAMEALTECAAKEVSPRALEHLMYECGIRDDDKPEVVKWAMSEYREEIL